MSDRIDDYRQPSRFALILSALNTVGTSTLNHDRMTPYLKALPRALLLVLVGALLFIPAHQSAAQNAPPLNQQFGLVNAYEAPQAAYQSGAGWELMTFRWDDLQPGGPGNWNAAPEVEDWLNSARAAGREVVGVLIGTPDWATDGQPGVGVPRGLSLPVSEPGNLWAAFVGQTVNYYAARGVNRWVIWEDPDIQPGQPGSTWEGTVGEYYQLVKVAYQVAKDANPNAQIHLGGVSYADPAWFGRFLDEAVDDPTARSNDYYFDVATVHIFGSSERIYTLTANHYFLMSQWGIPLKPVWLNQTNARPAVDPAVYPEDTRFRQFPNVTLEQQAAFIVQSYALSLAAGAEKVAVYRLADNLPADDGEAFGLVRTDGDPRPAYAAYQLIAQEFNGFTFARRVDEESHPLIDYVRLTFASKVTHVIWALTEQNATLVIPARSDLAVLIDLAGNRWTVAPEGGVYRVAVEGATCDDPVEGCLIGGAPWILVEEGVEDAIDEVPPAVRVEPGGVPLTPDPGMIMTATALAAPTATPTPPPTETPLPALTATATESPAGESEGAGESAAPAGGPPEETEPTALAVAEAPPEPDVAPAEEEAPSEEEGPSPEELALQIEQAVRPRGLLGLLPYLMIGLGVIVIAGGGWYFFRGSSSAEMDEEWSEEPVDPGEEWVEEDADDSYDDFADDEPHDEEEFYEDDPDQDDFD
jgi:hypothetical protein